MTAETDGCPVPMFVHGMVVELAASYPYLHLHVSHLPVPHQAAQMTSEDRRHGGT